MTELVPSTDLIALAILIGFGLLAWGGDMFVRSVAGVSRRFGISSGIAGGFVMGFGTSLPELFTSLSAVFTGEPELATGNIIGSNIANSLLIVGCAGLFGPLVIRAASVGRDLRAMLVATIGYFPLVFLGLIPNLAGAVLFCGLIIYMSWSMNRGADVAADDDGDDSPLARVLVNHPCWSVVFGLVGLGCLLIGAKLAVLASAELGRRAGIPDSIIGLSVVAIGTSLPELGASLMAARAGRSDLAIANVVGSNLFNLLAIGGITSMVAGWLPFDLETFGTDYAWMAVSALLLMWLVKRSSEGRHKLWGIVLLVGYGVYCSALAWRSIGL